MVALVELVCVATVAMSRVASRDVEEDVLMLRCVMRKCGGVDVGHDVGEDELDGRSSFGERSRIGNLVCCHSNHGIGRSDGLGGRTRTMGRRPWTLIRIGVQERGGPARSMPPLDATNYSRYREAFCHPPLVKNLAWDAKASYADAKRAQRMPKIETNANAVHRRRWEHLAQTKRKPMPKRNECKGGDGSI